MREKCLEYLKKPTKKLLDELTTMEQKWVEQEMSDKSNDDASKAAKPKKP